MGSSTGYMWSKSGIPTADSGVLPSIVAAATLALDGTSLVYKVTGTTGITAITGLPVGQRVTLWFTGILTLTNGAALVLRGGADATTAANRAITFVSDGTTVLEVGRNY